MAVLHLTIFVGDYAPHSAALPVAGWHGDDLCVWFDHRTHPADRLRFISSLVDPDEVTSLDRVVVDPAPAGCPTVHDWCHVEQREGVVGATCHRCGAFEALGGQPLRAYRPLITLTPAEVPIASAS